MNLVLNQIALKTVVNGLKGKYKKIATERYNVRKLK
jgi:hypothetical protein